MWKTWNYQKENVECILESKPNILCLYIYVKEQHILSHSLGTSTFNQSQFAVRLVCLKCKIYSAALKLQWQQNNLNILYGSQKFRLVWVYGRSVWNHLSDIRKYC